MFLLLQCCARWFHFNPFRISVKAIEREQCCTAAASALTVVRWASLPPVQTISITSSLSGLIWLFAASYLTFYAKKEIPDARSCCVLIQLEAVDGSWFISLAKQLMGVTIIYSEQTRARHYHFWPLLLLLLTCGWEMLRLQSKSTGNDLRAVALCPEVAALVRVPQEPRCIAAAQYLDVPLTIEENAAANFTGYSEEFLGNFHSHLTENWTWNPASWSTSTLWTELQEELKKNQFDNDIGFINYPPTLVFLIWLSISSSFVRSAQKVNLFD